MEIRDAVADDWVRIWPFLRDIVRAGETYTWPRDVTEDTARDMWMAAAPPNRTLVAVDGDTVLGTAKMGPNHRGPAAHIASASFMVAPEHSGKGVGRALGQYVLDQARADGFRAMQFNAVVETNTRAVALWVARVRGHDDPAGRLPARHQGLRGAAHHVPAPLASTA